MAETNDPLAHLASLNLLPNSITMLNGQRYHQRHRFNANQWFKIPANIWNAVNDDPTNQHSVNNHTYSMVSLLRWYLRRHFNHQLPRILTLERYYLGDNDIHYWRSNKIRRADNRIANNYPRYITDFDTGLFVGKPVKYGYSNTSNDNDDGKDLLDQIKEFNNSSDTRHHDIQMVKDLLNTGRAYELTYVQADTNTPKVTRINPNQCFVVYSTDVDVKELAAVRYTFQKVENIFDYQIEVYTSDKIFTFDAGSDIDGEWQLINQQDNPFNAVPITEYVLNDERVGKWEPELDDIDALDKAMSEMANSQEDFSNATMVISGAVKRPSDYVRYYDTKNRPIFYQRGHYQDIHYLTTHAKDKLGRQNRPVMVKKATDTKSNVLWLMPSTDENGNVKSQPTIQYLTKQLDVNEWQTYINELTQRIEKFTGVPNLDNGSSSGNQTELETMTKLLDAVENSSNFESNFRHGIIRRLKLLVGYWSKLPSSNPNHITSNPNQNDPNDITIHFDINLPLDVQSTIQEIQILAQSGKISTETLHELDSKLTGVPANQEDTRLSSENDDQQQSNQASLNSGLQTEANAAGIGNSNLKSVSSSASDMGSSLSESDISDSSNPLDNGNGSNSINTSVDSNGLEIASQSSSDFQLGSQANSETTSILTSGNNSNSSQQITGEGIVASASSSAASDSSMDGDTTIENATSFVDANGSVVGINNPKGNNMVFAQLIMDSLYGANGGFPSGFDSAMSSAISQAGSMSMANVSSSAPSDEDFDNPSDDLLDDPNSSDDNS